MVKQLVRDEVHTPAFVPGVSTRPDLTHDARNTAAGCFLTDYQTFCAVESVYPFVVDLPP